MQLINRYIHRILVYKFGSLQRKIRPSSDIIDLKKLPRLNYSLRNIQTDQTSYLEVI